MTLSSFTPAQFSDYLYAVNAAREGKPVQFAYHERPDIWHNRSHEGMFDFSPRFLWRPKPSASTFVFPPGFTPHNPDNLTPEQVGEGWRLLAEGEYNNSDRLPKCRMWIDNKWKDGSYYGLTMTQTFSVPDTIPLPTPPPFWSGREDLPPGMVWLRRIGTKHEELVTKVSEEFFETKSWRFCFSGEFVADWHNYLWSPDRSPNSWRECRKEGGK